MGTATAPANGGADLLGIDAVGTDDALGERSACAMRTEVADSEAGSGAPLFRKLDAALGMGAGVLIRPEGCKRFCCRPPDATTLEGSGGRLCCPYPDCAKLLNRIRKAQNTAKSR